MERNSRTRAAEPASRAREYDRSRLAPPLAFVAQLHRQHGIEERRVREAEQSIGGRERPAVTGNFVIEMPHERSALELRGSRIEARDVAVSVDQVFVPAVLIFAWVEDAEAHVGGAARDAISGRCDDRSARGEAERRRAALAVSAREIGFIEFVAAGEIENGGAHAISRDARTAIADFERRAPGYGAVGDGDGHARCEAFDLRVVERGELAIGDAEEFARGFAWGVDRG